MAFITNGIIKAVDYNTNASNLLALWGTGNGISGYGQVTHTPPIPVVPTLTPSVVAFNPAYLIKGSDALAFRQIIERIAVHQGTTVNLPPQSDYAIGAIRKAYTSSVNDLQTLIASVTTNRLNSAPGSVTVNSGVITGTRTTPWGTGGSQSITHEFTSSFINEDEARWFFNSGGQIRIDLSRTGGSSTAQNTSWTNLLASMGTFIINFGTSSITGSGGTTLSNIGYYGLTTSYQSLHIRMPSGGSFSSNQAVIRARVENVSALNGGNGNVIRFQIVCTDNSTGGGYYSDQVNGTFTSSIGLRKATTYLTINAPTLVTTVSP